MKKLIALSLVSALSLGLAYSPEAGAYSHRKAANFCSNVRVAKSYLPLRSRANWRYFKNNDTTLRVSDRLRRTGAYHGGFYEVYEPNHIVAGHYVRGWLHYTELRCR